MKRKNNVSRLVTAVLLFAAVMFLIPGRVQAKDVTLPKKTTKIVELTVGDEGRFIAPASVKAQSSSQSLDFEGITDINYVLTVIEMVNNGTITLEQAQDLVDEYRISAGIPFARSSDGTEEAADTGSGTDTAETSDTSDTSDSSGSEDVSGTEYTYPWQDTEEEEYEEPEEEKDKFNCYSWSVLEVSEDGSFKAVGPGFATLSYTPAGSEESVSWNIRVIPDYDDVKIKKGKTSIIATQDQYDYGTEGYDMRSASSAQFTVTGLGSFYLKNTKNMEKDQICVPCYAEAETVSGTVTADTDWFYVYDNVVSISLRGTGKVRITLHVGPKTSTMTVKVKQFDFEDTSLVIGKGESVTLKTVSKFSGLTWSTSNKKIATVSSSGKVTGKKKGHCLVTCKMGDRRIGISVNVTTPTIAKAVNRCVWIGNNWTYSQAQRMSDGYYDCSAAVWKAYAYAGKYLTGARSYAPTAAGLAEWLVNNGKQLEGDTYALASEGKLQPGDLTFSTGENNGRFQGIYHVEMVKGYQFHGWNSDGGVSENLVSCISGGGDLACRPY